jgi:hypothetical protein
MATFNASDLLSRARHLGQYGETNGPKFKVTPTAAALNDVLRFGVIPAGSEVRSIILANDDLDSNGSPTLAFKLGYTPVTSNEGSLAADDDYFVAAGDTSLQAANAGKVFSRFDAIKFEQDVFLDLTVSTATATFAAGSVWAQPIMGNVGVK